MTANLDLVAGTKSRIVQSFPVMLLMIGLAGAAFAALAQEARPEVYANLTEGPLGNRRSAIRKAIAGRHAHLC